jgi:hypothetical protein
MTKLSNLTKVTTVGDDALFYIVDPARSAGDRSVGMDKDDVKTLVGGGGAVVSKTGTTITLNEPAYYNRDSFLTSGDLTIDLDIGGANEAVENTYVYVWCDRYVPNFLGASVLKGSGEPIASAVNLIMFYYDGVHVIRNTINLSVLATPTLSVVSGNEQLILSWSGDVSADTYTLERSTDNFATAGTVVYTGANLNFTDTGLSNGTTYQHRVKASGKDILESNYSNITSEQPNLSFFLDDYTDVAYAVSTSRKLKSGVTNIVEVRNSLDDSVAAYSADDVQAGLTAIGSNSGFVTKLIQQDGVSLHGDLVQATFADQPKIKDVGTMYLNSGVPYIKFEGAGDILRSSLATGIMDKNATIYAVFKTQNSSSNQYYLDEYISSTAGRISFNSCTNSNLDGVSHAPGGAQFVYDNLVEGQLATNQIYLQTFVSNQNSGGSTDKFYYLDGVLQVSQARGGIFSQDTQIQLGDRFVASTDFEGEFAELIIFNTVHDDTKRQEIEANIKAHYGIV